MVTSTEMVNALFTNFGLLVQAYLPLLYLFFGVFLALFGVYWIWRMWKKGLTKVLR